MTVTSSCHSLPPTFANADKSKRHKVSSSGETTQDGTPTRATAGEVFADGTTLELIRLDDRSLQLAVWNGTVSQVDRYVQSGFCYQPVTLPEDIANAIVLPSECAPPGISANELIDGMSNALTTHISADPEALCLAAYCALATWFPDCLAIAPTLTIFGPTAEVADVLRLLRCFCRRGILLNTLGPRELGWLPLELRPTLLILQAEQWIERAGSLLQRTDFFHSTREGLHQRYCCTIAHASETSQPDLEAIHISVPPASGCSTLSPELLDQLAAKFQPKLLSFRLCHLQEARSYTPDLREFTRGVAEMTAGLMAAVGDDEQRGEIRRLMKSRNEQVVSDRTSTPQSVVIEAILACCHAPESPKDVYVHDITEIANKIAEGRVELLHLSPRETGAVLKILGLRTRRLGGGGRGLRLSDEVRCRVHKLARDYQVRSRPTEDIGCRHCEARKTIEDIE